MYNEENNQYHYTYRSDNQPGQSYDTGSYYQYGAQQPVQEMKPVKKQRKGLKIVALALVCALLGGIVGGGVAWGITSGAFGGYETEVRISGRPVTEVELMTVDGKTQMTDAEVYAANVNSVVSINVTHGRYQLFRSAGADGFRRFRFHPDQGRLYCYQLPCGRKCGYRHGDDV